MLNTSSAEKLAAILDQFSIPMFAVERASDTSDFALVCINRAHAEATGLASEGSQGVALRDLLSPKQANNVAGRYAECARTQSPLRYLETLTLPAGVQQWDTTIQPVRLASGADRVIGTAIQIAGDSRSEGTQITFDNIRYFSALADMQLQNLLSMFDAAREQGLFSNDSASRVSRLCGVCRSVQRSVEDIRQTVRLATPATSRTKSDLDSAGGSTLRALNESTAAEG